MLSYPLLIQLHILTVNKEMQTQIANELKTHNLITIIRINDILCDFCDELIPTLGYTDHMNEKHSEILDEVIQAQGKYEKCRHCGDVIKNDFNDVIRHLGDKHYDSLPVELESFYMEWKSAGFPRMESDLNKYF